MYTEKTGRMEIHISHDLSDRDSLRAVKLVNAVHSDYCRQVTLVVK